jgi:hypothetical protein
MYGVLEAEAELGDSKLQTEVIYLLKYASTRWRQPWFFWLFHSHRNIPDAHSSQNHSLINHTIVTSFSCL